MLLQRGEVIDCDFDRMAVDFTMIRGSRDQQRGNERPRGHARYETEPTPRLVFAAPRRDREARMPEVLRDIGRDQGTDGAAIERFPQIAI